MMFICTVYENILLVGQKHILPYQSYLWYGHLPYVSIMFPHPCSFQQKVNFEFLVTNVFMVILNQTGRLSLSGLAYLVSFVQRYFATSHEARYRSCVSLA